MKGTGGAEKKAGRGILNDFIIDEISGVDKMAQEGAEALLMKRHSPEQEAFEALLKSGQLMLTSDKKGHSHLLDVSQEGGTTSHNTSSGAEYGHSHPWVKTADGIVVIGAAEGHSHSLVEKRYEVEDDGLSKREFSAEQRRAAAKKGFALPDGSYPIENTSDLRNAIQAFGRAKDKGRVAAHIKRRARALGATDMLPEEGALSLGKSVEGIDMSKEQSMTENKDNKTSVEMVEKKELQDAQAELAIAKAYGALSDAEKAHYGGLGEDEKSAFLKLDESGRAKELEKARAEDPVVYTAEDGREFRKSDDPRIVEEVKKGDADRKENRELRKKLEDKELAKRAEDELGNMAGKDEVKIALLKAVDGIEDAGLQKGAREILASMNSGMAEAFKRAGHRDGKAGDAEQRYEALAKAHAEKNEVTIEQARAAVLETEEGAELYREMQG